MNLRIAILLVFIILGCQDTKPEVKAISETKIRTQKAPVHFVDSPLSRPYSNEGEIALAGNNLGGAIAYYSREGRTPYDQYMLSYVFIKMKDYTAALGLLKELLDAEYKEDWIADAEWNYLVCNKKLKRWGVHTKELENSICNNPAHKHYNKCK